MTAQLPLYSDLDDDTARRMIRRHTYPCQPGGWGATGSTSHTKTCEVCGKTAKGKDAGTLVFAEPPVHRCGLCAFRMHLDWCPLVHVLAEEVS